MKRNCYAEWTLCDAMRMKWAALGSCVNENKLLSIVLTGLVMGCVWLLMSYSGKRAGVNPSPPLSVPGMPMQLSGKPPAPPPAVG